MIRYIKINEYKGLKNLEYNFGHNIKSNSKIHNLQAQINENYNLIYGKNSVGKTRFLSVFEHFKNVLFSIDYENEAASYFISFSNIKYIYNVEVITSLQKVQTINITYSKNDEKKSTNELLSFDFSQNLPSLKLMGESVKNELVFQLVLNSQKGFLTKILYLAEDKEVFKVLNDLGDFLFYDVRINFEKQIQEKFFSWKEFLMSNEIGVKELVTLEEANERKNYETKINLLISEIDPQIKNVSFGNFPLEESINKIEFYKQEPIIISLINGDKFSINSKNISQGITRIISIFQEFLWVGKKDGRILIIDEFDPFLHDFLYMSLTRVLISVIGDNSQIITVSHNSVILNELKRKQILFMDEINNEIKLFNPDAKHINFNNSNIYKRYLNEEYIKNTIFDSDFEGLFYG